MPFAWYNRLSKARKKIYRASDAIESIPLPRAQALLGAVADLEQALAAGAQGGTAAAARAIVDGITQQLALPPVRVKVLAVRPHDDYGELHGLYEPAEGRARALVTVWMRTARQRRVVAFRSFLRTILHELCHHADYEMFDLPESLHTEGFFKRESSLFRQLVTQGHET